MQILKGKEQNFNYNFFFLTNRETCHFLVSLGVVTTDFEIQLTFSEGRRHSDTKVMAN